MPEVSSVQELRVLPGANYTRLSPSLKESADNLGPLADLLGTWVGTKGWNMIAVPFPKTDNVPFSLLVAPYMETMTFSPIGAKVPNRFGGGIAFVTGLLYELRISRLDTNEPMHVENGMWLFLDPASPKNGIARLAAIPHGDSILAIGDYGTYAGAPKIATTAALPSDQNPFYIKQYGDDKTPEFDPKDPEQTLRSAIAHQTIVETTTISMSTANGGGLLNIPFIGKNANTTSFEATFWIEKVQTPGGQSVQQLQYTQKSVIEFVQQPGKPAGDLIKWPHVNLNTLVKQ